MPDKTRRTVIFELGGATAALGLAGPQLALEAARHGLTLASAEEREAERALDEFRELLSDLPATITSEKESSFGWPEERLRHTESFVYSHLGEYDKADAAPSRAIALYPASYPRGPALIELQRALISW
jgi:hypothetical protein